MKLISLARSGSRGTRANLGIGVKIRPTNRSRASARLDPKAHVLSQKAVSGEVRGGGTSTGWRHFVRVDHFCVGTRSARSPVCPHLGRSTNCRSRIITEVTSRGRLKLSAILNLDRSGSPNSGKYMANQDHVEILAKGEFEWNRWRKESTALVPDLCGANLKSVDLRGMNLGGVLLRHAVLQRAILRGTNLSGADLRAADLAVADLRVANLTDASLEGAHLRRADLTGAEVKGVDFSGAIVGSTVFGNLDLRQCKGLDTLQHVRPSTIGVDTVYRSFGRIPEPFLRGCGVPEAFVCQISALVTALEPIQFYSCFISYSTDDQDFAERLHADLQAKGVRCWFAAHDIMGGRKLHEQLEEAIQIHDRLLLILSQASMRSDWVKIEIAKARLREKQERRRVLFPIRLVDWEALRGWQCFHADALDLAAEIREYYVPDFSLWDRDGGEYRHEFAKLLRALRSESADVSSD